MLDTGVDRGDVFVAGRPDRQRLPHIPALRPHGGDRVEVIIEAASTDAAVRGVGGEYCGVAGAEAECGGGFPDVGEAVEFFELDRAGGVAEVVSQLATDSQHPGRLAHGHQRRRRRLEQFVENMHRTSLLTHL